MREINQRMKKGAPVTARYRESIGESTIVNKLLPEINISWNIWNPVFFFQIYSRIVVFSDTSLSDRSSKNRNYSIRSENQPEIPMKKLPSYEKINMLTLNNSYLSGYPVWTYRAWDIRGGLNTYRQVLFFCFSTFPDTHKLYFSFGVRSFLLSLFARACQW